MRLRIDSESNTVKQSVLFWLMTANNLSKEKFIAYFCYLESQMPCFFLIYLIVFWTKAAPIQFMISNNKNNDRGHDSIGDYLPLENFLFSIK